MVRCDTCEKPLEVGEWPFCPHGFGNNLQKPMEPHTDEMIAGTPVEFRTVGEKVRYMDQHNLVPAGDSIRRESPGLKSKDIQHAIREVFQELR